MKHVLLIDNYDSFTFNLYQYIGELTDKVTVARNSDVPLGRIRAGEFTHIVISPGPGDPTDRAYFGACHEVIREFYQTYPILGICLGHQGIGAAFGGKVVRAPVIMHGKTSRLAHRNTGVLKGLPKEVEVMRYHSLVIATESLPDELVVDAVANDGSIMAMHHAEYPIFGLQFHPESFATGTGKQMLSNFLQEGNS
jgi:anthranilate synthase component 2